MRSCPIRYKLSHTAFIAPDFRISEMNVALVLKKIQMTPHLFHSIVDGTMFLIADWTGKLTAAPEINVDVEFADLFIKRNILDVKRFFDSQRHFKKV